MGKLCPRGKAAAKARFKVYPSAYANMYASAVCSGKITPGGKKNKLRKKPWVVLFLKTEKPYLLKEWLKVDQLLQQVVEWLIQVDAKKPNSTSKEVNHE